MSDLIPILPSTINGCDSSGPTAARPKSPDRGQVYYDQEACALLIYDGAGWIEANCKGSCGDCKTKPCQEPQDPAPPATPTLEDEPAPTAEVPQVEAVPAADVSEVDPMNPKAE